MNELRSSYALFAGEKSRADNGKPLGGECTLKRRAEALYGLERFSTPGHHGQLCEADLTEYDEDELFPADGVRAAESRAAEFYGVKKARLLTGGASMGVKAALLAVKTNVVMPEFTHRSAFEGAELAGEAAHVFPTGEERGLPLPPDADMYERAFDAFPDAGAALVTSPDYFGRTAPVKEIAKVCRRRGKKLVADCAHGAHFASRPDLFPEGGERTADVAVLSAHKTLRALGQGAVGTVNDQSLFSAYDRALTLLGTSSPSYPILVSLDEAIAFERSHAASYDGLVRAAAELKSSFDFIASDDPLRLTLDCGRFGMTGREMFYALKERGILAETFVKNYCVFIITLSDRPEKAEKLRAALDDVSRERAL